MFFWLVEEAQVYALPSPSPRSIPNSASPWFPRSIRCAATPSPPKAEPRAWPKPDDSLDEHAYDTISGGDWLSDQDAVEAFVKEAPQELLQLEHWGCPWNREPDGHIAVRAFGGMKKRRTWFAADKTGFHMLHTLFQTSLKYDPITRYDEWFVTKLLVDDGRVQGVVAIELMSGKIQAITAKAVILCTGGCGRVFPFTTNANIKNGDGMALAYRAGAPLKDMEFVQYHPTGLPFTGILITEAARAEGGYMLNKDGYRYLQDYNLGTPEAKPVLRSMELGPRDRLSQAFVKEDREGAHDSDAVRLGRSPRPAPSGREAHQRKTAVRPRAVPEVPEYRSGQGTDSGPAGGALHDGRRAAPTSTEPRLWPGCSPPAKSPVSASTARTAWARTRCPSAWCLARAPDRPPPSMHRQQPTPNGKALAQADEERRRLESQFLNKTGGRERIATIRNEMQSTVEKSAGIYREQSLLTEGAAKLRELQERYRGHQPRRPQPHLQHRTGISAGAWASCSTWRSRSCSARCIAPSLAGRTSGPITREGRREVPRAFADLSQP